MGGIRLASVAAMLLEASGMAAAEWPGWRGPNRDGMSGETGLLEEWPEKGPRLLWSVDGIGRGYSSVAVAGGIVYATGDIGGRLVLSAFDLAGNPLWKADCDAEWSRSEPGSRSTPVVDGGKVYVLSGNGVIGCYDAKGGARVWTRAMREFGGRVPGWGYSESVLIDGTMAIVTPGGKNCVVALDKQTGETIWTSTGFEAEAHYGSAIAVEFGGVRMIVAGTGGGIAGFDARTGACLWSNDFSAGNTANCLTPAHSEGRIFWANGYGQGGICLALALEGGKPVAKEAWRTDDMDCHHGGFIIDRGYIYGNNGGGWACVSLATGKRMWRAKGVGKGSLCAADGRLYLFGEDGGRVGLAEYSPQGLRMRGEFRVKGAGPSWAHPAVAGGRLYLRYDRNLYCFDVRAR